MPPRRRKRIDPTAFDLPVERIRRGFYSDRYFVRAREIVRADQSSPAATLQFSGKTEGWLSGIDEAIAVLKLCADDWGALTVHALYEGDFYESWETVLSIEGPYESFGYLETLCLGTLARRTRICSNAKLISNAASSKPVMVFGARDDAFLMQPGDGFSATVGGVKLLSTEAQASLIGGKLVATVPHALIALCGGDAVTATKRFAEAFEDAELIALVDYANDSVKTSVDVAKALEGLLWGVRLDTAETMVDQSVLAQMGGFKPTGVNANLVWNVRNALDAEGFGEVKIVASGGFDAPRIAAFEEDGVPVDAYGVGSALFDGRYDFTADIVQVNGKAESKAGRSLRPNPRMERVK